MIVITFNISGKPKITGSLTLKIPQGRVILPNALYLSLLAVKNIIITKPIVAPQPPIQAKSHQPKLIVWTIPCPAASEAVFSDI